MQIKKFSRCQPYLLDWGEMLSRLQVLFSDVIRSRVPIFAKKK